MDVGWHIHTGPFTLLPASNNEESTDESMKQFGVVCVWVEWRWCFSVLFRSVWATKVSWILNLHRLLPSTIDVASEQSIELTIESAAYCRWRRMAGWTNFSVNAARPFTNSRILLISLLGAIHDPVTNWKLCLGDKVIEYDTSLPSKILYS